MPGSPDPAARPSPVIGLIWAQANGGVIGADGVMPWHLPEDLKHFKRTTKGSPVVMGRRTWESFPARFRPLPGRTNIVITRNEAFDPDGALRARDLPEGLRLAREAVATAEAGRPAANPSAPQGVEAATGPSATPGASPTIWVIGGGGVYREAIDDADLLVVTEIDLEVDGDTTAPVVPAAFEQVSSEPPTGWHQAEGGLRYRFLTYRR